MRRQRLARREKFSKWWRLLDVSFQADGMPCAVPEPPPSGSARPLSPTPEIKFPGNCKYFIDGRGADTVESHLGHHEVVEPPIKLFG